MLRMEEWEGLHLSFGLSVGWVDAIPGPSPCSGDDLALVAGTSSALPPR